MPLNKLDNFIKNTEGRILYVSPSDLDSTDSISNQGNSLAQPFKTLQRALLEAARFSYQKGNSNDDVEKTTILLMPGAHTVDNRPGFSVFNDGGVARAVSPSGAISSASNTLSLTLNSVFDLTQDDNILYKFNSINGGVVVPRGTSIVGLDLRKTKIRPKYVPNPTDPNVPNSAIFRITGACYFWQFCIFDGNLEGTVYTDPADFSVNNQSIPTFSHHKLTCFEYADGVNEYENTGLTDLDMYYAKLSNAFNLASGRDIDQKYPQNPGGFEKQRPEWEIVGAFATDPIQISTIESGSGGTASSQVTVKTAVPHELTAGTPIKISGVSPANYNISTKVQSISETDPTVFTYLLPNFPINLTTPGNASSGFVTIETDTVSGASPYIFNISLRSVYGMNGMLADGSKASGFRSMVVAQFTGVSLQKDDRAFVRYNPTNRNYSDSISITREAGASLSGNSSSTSIAYHLEPLSIYRSGWETSHIKATNDAFIQVVSVFAIGFNKQFDAETGADLSITNSNSNFGQISLNSSGFKKEAFTKDNKAFITSIITPRTIVGEEDNIDWLQFDVAKIDAPGSNNTRLYLFGFTSEDDVPPILTQGYRIGAKLNDKLYFSTNGTEYSANILMTDGISSSVKEYVSSVPSSNIFTLGTHNIQTNEKVIILSDIGDLPENIVENTVYYAIRSSSTGIKLAASATAATNGIEIAVYGGTSLRILSRVSDKIAGDVGHPVQYDGTQWYITTNAGSEIYTRINELGVAGLTDRTEPSYVKRTADSRSLDEKLYKIRVVIPKELGGAKTPEDGFVIQQTSSTGYRNNNDPTSSSIVKSDYEYNKNLSLIAKCTRLDSIVTIISELPHNLRSGDSVIIKNVTDSTNTIGQDDRGYNGTFTVSFVDDMTFTYTTTRTPGTTFTNNTTSRTILSPRFERNNLQSNIYSYRNELITPYIESIQDGVYHIYALIADRAVPTEFTNIKYSQNVVDLYPQLDRDNIHDNPPSAKSFAKRAPLGEVVTNDLKKSITKESINTVLTSFGVGLDISTVSNSTTSATITFDREHGLAGIVTCSSLIGGAGYNTGTFQNVKLLNGSGSGTWKGATARVVVSGGAIVSADIVSSGSGYSAADVGLYFDSSVLDNGNNAARFNIATSGITTAIGNVVQFTGDGTTLDTYHRITAVSADNQISIAKTSGDPVVTANQYAFVLGPSVLITTTTYSSIDSSVGIRTFNCSAPHGLVAGNKFRVIDSSNNNRGDYVVSDRLNINSFTALTPAISSVDSGYILKHGLSANGASSDSDAENLGTRSITFFDKETLVAASGISTTTTTVPVSNTYVAIAKRFPLGSYIQIDEEIMRVASSTLTTPSVGTVGITVIRGVLATKQVPHDSGSLVRKIKPIPIEFRRPSIVRASGHTFEYLGYGPGNYSTGLPQVQVITLTEREEFLVQSQERSGGIVVYTGMNNNGDSFIGNRKTSSATGEEITFDNPIPTVTGEDPSRLSAIFDEVTVKERLVVEGGNSGTVLSQFDGPVTFNKEVGIKGNLTLGVNSILKITNPSVPASITGDLFVGDGMTVGGNSTLSGQVIVNTGIIPDTDEGAYIGSSIRPFSEAWIGEIGIATGTTDVEDRTIRAVTGNLTLAATTGNSVAISNNTSVTGDLNVSGKISAAFLDVPNVAPIGSIVIWSSASSPPANWRICNGSQLSQTTYSELYTLIGNTYNTGGETVGNFRIPELRDRFVVGSGPSYGLNSTGGAATVNLLTTQIPSHTHTHNMDAAGSHNHGGTNSGGAHAHTMNAAGSHSHDGATGGAGSHNHDGATAGAGSHSHGGDTGSNGSHGHSLNPAGNHSHGLSPSGSHNHPYAIGGPIGRASGGNQVSNFPYSSSRSTGDGGDHTHGMGGAGDHSHSVNGAPNHQHSISAVGNHQHSISSVSNHAHSINTEPNHTHTIDSVSSHTHTINSDGSHTHGFSINSTGGGQSHENLPPYRALNYIIRII